MMWETPIERYLRLHPECTLKEYCDYLANSAKEEAERKRLEEERNNQFLKSFEGKCFRINFNGQTFGYFKVTKNPLSKEPLREDFYSVYITSDITTVSFEKNRMINRLWLPGQGREECVVIPEELFNKIVKYYQEMCIMAEKIRDKEL